jgi:hypothetical protein
MGQFAAAGESGTIDFFSPEGKLEKTVELPAATAINDVYVFRDCLVAAADGLLAFYREGELSTLPIQGNAVSMTMFRDRLVVGVNVDNDATVLYFSDLSDKPEIVALPAAGSLKALSSNMQSCFGVTSNGEILKTSNLTDWDILDFNAEYKGYYPLMYFSDIEAGLENLAVIGTTDTGVPAMFISSQGTVWSYRELSYSASRGSLNLEEEPLSVIYDYLADQYILLCSGGVLFSVPACAHCNKLERINANELNSLAFTYQGDYFVVGSDNFSALVPRN